VRGIFFNKGNLRRGGKDGILSKNKIPLVALFNM